MGHCAQVEGISSRLKDVAVYSILEMILNEMILNDEEVL